jgi:hypothetical protein
MNRPGNEPYGIGHAIGDLAETANRGFEAHMALPPHAKAVRRAQYGTALAVYLAYGALFAPILTGLSAGELVSTFVHAPTHAPADIWVPLAVWSAAALTACMWLVSGLRQSAGGPRDGMAAYWSAFRLVAYAGLIYWSTYAPDDWQGWVAFGDMLLLPACAAELVGIFLHLRGGRRAKRIVAEQIADTAISWRPARRRATRG